MSSIHINEAGSTIKLPYPRVPVNIKLETFLDVVKTNLSGAKRYDNSSFLSTFGKFLTSKDNARKLLEAYQEGLNNSTNTKYRGEGYSDFSCAGTTDSYNFNKLNRLGKAFSLIVSYVNRFVGLQDKQVKFLEQAFQEATSEVLKDYTEHVIG